MAAYATPSKIYIIRHADKLAQNPGPALSPKGEIRAIAFAIRFYQEFPHPDFIFATDPVSNKNDGLYKKGLSIRELQTVGPLANLITIKNHDDFPILHPYRNKEYDKLAHDLLTEPEFNKKIILICWDHKLIPEIAKSLGVPDKDIVKWQKKDFDSIYYIDFNGKKPSGKLLLHRYSLDKKTDSASWQDIYDKLSTYIIASTNRHLSHKPV
jgi:hypothetical protein